VLPIVVMCRIVACRLETRECWTGSNLAAGSNWYLWTACSNGFKGCSIMANHCLHGYYVHWSVSRVETHQFSRHF